MKKGRKLAVMAICLLILVMIAMAAWGVLGKKPFKDLEEAQIVLATVHLTPPGQTVQIGDINTLTDLLKNIVIYSKDDSYTEYDGQGVVFTLTMEDGTQMEVIAYNPFVVINGVGYQTKYETCEALNAYANNLLNKDNAEIILEEPPELAVVCGDTSIGTLKSNYSWTSDGSSTLACGSHPLDSKELMSQFGTMYETAEDSVTLEFAETPNAFSVRCWSDAHWFDTAAEAEEVNLDGYELTLKPGGYVYEVKAEWDVVKGWGGTAEYSFYITKETGLIEKR